MKAGQKLIHLSASLLLCATLFSCNHYIDRAKTVLTWPVDEGRMQFYPDSNVLIFRTHMQFHADTETWSARSFEATIPKGLKSYEFDYGKSFIFYFNGDQAMAIWINIENLPNRPDSIYVPSEDELFSFIPSHFSVSSHKYDIRSIPYLSGRKQLLVRKKDVQILLLNIKHNNFEIFKKSIESFKFL